jgi:hypothetical protein
MQARTGLENDDSWRRRLAAYPRTLPIAPATADQDTDDQADAGTRPAPNWRANRGQIRLRARADMC